MTATGAFSAHGLTVRISSPDPGVVAAFDDVLVDMHFDIGSSGSASEVPGDTAGLLVEIVPLIARHGGAPTYRVSVDNAPVYETLIEGSVVSHVLMEVNQRVAAAVWSNGSIPLHASTVGEPSGAVVLAGASHSGKTTLAAALAVTGADGVQFLADEVSALHPTDLTIAPYGKPVALRTPGSDLLVPNVARLRRAASRFETDERFVPPSELGTPPSASARTIAVVFPRFDPAASATRLDPASPVAALTRLVQLTLGTRRVDTTTFRALERLVRLVDVYDLSYVDALDAADRLRAVICDGEPA